MWNYKRHLSLLLLIVLIGIISFSAVGTERAYACSCMPFDSYTAALEDSSHVLDATVVHKKEHKDMQINVTLEVAAKWKGEAKQSMNVLTAAYSDSCGYEFEIGKRYAVFANEHEGKLTVSLCSATSLIADDSPIFEELGSPEKLSTDGSNNGGVVATTAAGSEDSEEPYHPEQIKKEVTQDELEQRLDAQKSKLILIFAIVGGILILGAGILLFVRSRR